MRPLQALKQSVAAKEITEKKILVHGSLNESYAPSLILDAEQPLRPKKDLRSG